MFPHFSKITCSWLLLKNPSLPNDIPWFSYWNLHCITMFPYEIMLTVPQVACASMTWIPVKSKRSPWCLVVSPTNHSKISFKKKTPWNSPMNKSPSNPRNPHDPWSKKSPVSACFQLFQLSSTKPQGRVALWSSESPVSSSLDGCWASKIGALTIKNWWFNRKKMVGLTGKNGDWIVRNGGLNQQKWRLSKKNGS